MFFSFNQTGREFVLTWLKGRTKILPLCSEGKLDGSCIKAMGSIH